MKNQKNQNHFNSGCFPYPRKHGACWNKILVTKKCEQKIKKINKVPTSYGFAVLTTIVFFQL